MIIGFMYSQHPVHLRRKVLFLQLVHFNMHVLFYLEETAEFSSYTLKLFINKYIKFHLYQEAGLYLYLVGKAILFRDSYKNNSWFEEV